MANLAVGQTIFYINTFKERPTGVLVKTQITKVGRKYFDTNTHKQINVDLHKRDSNGNLDAIYFHNESHYNLWNISRIEKEIIAKIQRGFTKIEDLEKIAKILDLKL